jgi:hypothetical protein
MDIDRDQWFSATKYAARRDLEVVDEVMFYR